MVSYPASVIYRALSLQYRDTCSNTFDIRAIATEKKKVRFKIDGVQSQAQRFHEGEVDAILPSCQTFHNKHAI